MRWLSQPLLAVVTGRPGSGKTTLARTLAETVRLPLISRDALKEGLVRTSGFDLSQDTELTRAATDAFFGTNENLLRSGVSLIAEAAFQHKVWAPSLEPLLPISDVRIVICQISPEVAWQRMANRASLDPLWSRYHPFPEAHLGAEEPYDAPELPVPTMEVRTADGYAPALEEIASFLQ